MSMSVKEVLWGQTRVIQASGLEEAVDLAQRLKDDGDYDWFRGQLRDWPAHSSLRRLKASQDEERIEKTLRRYTMFAEWVRQQPELKYVLESANDFFAILQHYGVPTNYIDFSTE